MAKADLTADRLRELLLYDPETGMFTWRVNRRGLFAGSLAGYAQKNGYIQIGVDDSRCYAHRLAWLYQTGKLPDSCIDHLNGVRADNRWSNLRQADKLLNAENRRSANGNKVYGSMLGVEYVKGGTRHWAARICVSRVRHYLGVYETEQEAHEVYLAAKRRLHEGCTI